MSRFNHKASASQMRRKPYAAINYLESVLLPGDYSCFYDICQDGGVLDSFGAQCTKEGDEVWRLPQLLPSGTGSDMTFKSPNQLSSQDPLVGTNLTYRRGIKLPTGNYSNPRIPFIHYPRGLFDTVSADMTIGTDETNQVFRLGFGNLGTPPEWTPTSGFTYGFFGCRATAELAAFEQALTAEGMDGVFGSLDTFPAPDNPGSLIFRGTIDGLNLITDIYVNGNLQQHTVAPYDAGTSNGADVTEMFLMVGLFCWAVQKFFAITHPLSESELLELHNAFVGTMENYA